ncbi:protein spaetzle-like [Dendroctonus ponderosae]|nr:protein spaetzle-like isoform X2 [Dendroctonus ponderosae]XP_048522491.1 protein spaetzle isoform X2 [Dendroctonus ponderosae]XP_048522925.1 protein spaetzle-like [Dendroctonus ponderosae]
MKVETCFLFQFNFICESAQLTLFDFNDSRGSVQLQISKCKKGEAMCENVDFYPHRYIEDVLKNYRMPKLFFGQSEVPEDDFFSDRQYGEDGRFVCSSITRTIFPKSGQNKDNQWRFIVNQGSGDGFVQGVQVEVCRNPERECDIPGGAPLEYETFCKQKYIYKKLFALNERGELLLESFKMPSACCCQYKRRYNDFSNRMGFSGSESNGTATRVWTTV